jgi:hypothetical protein
MVSGVVVVAREQDWDLWLIVPAAILGAFAVYGALMAAMPRRDELLEEIK